MPREPHRKRHHVNITNVHLQLCDENNRRLRAYCSLVFDDAFVVHNIRIIEKNGELLMAMPSRKVTEKCRLCGINNSIDSTFCAGCGKRFDDQHELYTKKVHVDVVHPINADFRSTLEERIFKEYRALLKQPIKHV